MPGEHGSGEVVDGAIHRRGGPAIMQKTDEKYSEGCPTGSAVVTGAGNLKAKFVFHAVDQYRNLWLSDPRGCPACSSNRYLFSPHEPGAAPTCPILPVFRRRFECLFENPD